MTDNEEAPRTPLTLEFSPEPLDDDDKTSPIVICEPSFQHDGRIFLGVHPFGLRVGRVGLHMLPDDVRALRDHLNVLLMEPPEDDAIDWSQRIQAAAERVSAPNKKRPKRIIFRMEFSFFGIQGVIGRVNNG